MTEQIVVEPEGGLVFDFFITQTIDAGGLIDQQVDVDALIEQEVEVTALITQEVDIDLER